MNLSDIFDIIYVDEDTKDKYESVINNIKINNLLHFNSDISNQVLILVTKNTSYNKSYSKLKLEFHNVEDNNINNDMIVNVLNKIQNIMNNDDTENDENEESLINPSMAHEIKLILTENEYLQLHLFQKKYNKEDKNYTTNTIKYVTSFQLNEKINVKNNYNIEHEEFGKFDLDESEIKLLNNLEFSPSCDINYLSNVDYYYKKFRTFSHQGQDDYDIIYEYLENYEICDDYLLKNINKIMSGYYLNYNDISLQIIIKLIILSTIGGLGDNHKYLTHSDFSLNNSLNNYFTYNKNVSDVFEKILITNLNIMCDACNEKITHNIVDKYYHSDIGGDLCEKCYKIKKDKFYERIKYLKSKILLVGRNSIFKKDIAKTRLFLKNKKFKMKKKPYYKLLETINKNLVKINSTTNLCKICYQPLKTDIYVGSECGHCFHKSCLDLCPDTKCQICRTETKFIQLFL